MDIDSLQSWKEALQNEIEELQSKVSPLEAEIRVRREKLAAIERLIRLEEDPLSVTVGSTRKDASVAGGTVADVAYSILKKLGEPLHYKELYSAVQNAGWSLNGKDPATNLIAKIGRDPRFERVARGTYALREWDSRRKKRVLKE